MHDKMKLTIGLLLIVVALCFGLVNASTDNKTVEVIPPNPTGFIGKWHPAPECVQCHVSLLPDNRLSSMVSSCVCHANEYETGSSIDNKKISAKAHGIKTCIDCHIGTGVIKGEEIPSREIHRVHENVSCEGCHGTAEKTVIPKSANCNSCHTGGVHSIHGNRTGDLCVVCHGAFGIKYKEAGYQMKGEIPVTKKEEEKVYPTILNILKALFEFVTGAE